MNQEDLQKALEAISKGGIHVAGDLVLEKKVEYEVNNVEDGGIGIQIINGSKADDEEDGDESHELVDLTFFSMKKYGTIEGQEQLRRVLRSITPKMDVDSGRDWVAVYIAYHYLCGQMKLMKDYVSFFTDIEALLPDVLNKVKRDEKGDKRYRSYTESLSSECGNWFIENECLPPMNEWTARKYMYGVSDGRKKRIQELVKDIYQGLNS
jgi:hypothetical protein